MKIIMSAGLATPGLLVCPGEISARLDEIIKSVLAVADSMYQCICVKYS